MFSICFDVIVVFFLSFGFVLGFDFVCSLK